MRLPPFRLFVLHAVILATLGLTLILAGCYLVERHDFFSQQDLVAYCLVHPGLTNLEVWTCPHLVSLPKLPNSLTGLVLDNCDELKELPPLPNSIEQEFFCKFRTVKVPSG